MTQKNMISHETRVANGHRSWVTRRAGEAARQAREVEAATMTIDDAAAAGIERLRDPRWVGPMDHIKIDIIDGKPGPWVHLFCPSNVEINGRDPVDMLIFQLSAGAKGLRYDGPLPDSEEYCAEAAKWVGRLKDAGE